MIDPLSGPNSFARIDVAAVARALEEAGLLRERRGAVPDWAATLAADSRDVTPGSVFVAVRGAVRDGHEFLADAAGRGAVAAIVEDAEATTLPALVVREGRRAAAIAAAAAYGHPAQRLLLVGVTGTNGKTTTVGMLRHLLDGPGRAAASVGTLGVLVGSSGQALPGGGGLTTPGPVELQRVFRRLVDAGVRAVAMEVSSHALDQHRVEGVAFDAAVFTNFSRDHLDYHGSMEAYLTAKARLAEHVTPDGALVVNADEPAWGALVARGRGVAFSTTGVTDAAVSMRDVVHLPRGSRAVLVVDGASAPVHIPLLGDFNVANAAAAAAGATAVGMAIDEIAVRLGTLPQVPGRLEVLHERPVVLRDYAHTPDALDRALRAVRPFTAGRLTVVFGCGGDRDRGKRPEMGRIAEQRADAVILTSDNPRTEDPERILDDIEGGMTRRDHRRVEDRRAAIAEALATAGADDVVLLAGKGHETYQIRGSESLPFDERAIVGELTADAAAASAAVGSASPGSGA